MTQDIGSGALEQALEDLRIKLAEKDADLNELQSDKAIVEASENQLRMILDSMTEFIILQDKDHNILWANRSAANSQGGDASDLIGIKCHTFKFGAEAQCANCPVQKTITNCEPAHGELITPDGRVQYIWSYPIKFQDGEVQQVLEIARDITISEMAKSALEESEERYRSLAAFSQDIILIIERDGAIQYMNRDMLGRPAESFLGTNLFNYIFPDDPIETKKIIGGVFETGEPATFDVKGLNDENAIGLFRARLTPIFRDDKVDAVTVCASNVSRDEEISIALQASEERYKFVMQVMPFPVVMTDRDCVVTYANMIIPGYDPEEILGRSMLDIITVDDIDEIRMLNRRVFDAGGEETYRLKGPSLSGAIGDFEAVASRLTIGEEPIAVIHIARELTQELKVAEALRESEERYKALSEASFEGLLMSHEGVIIDANDNVARMTGYTVDELIGKQMFDMMDPSDVETVKQRISSDDREPYQIAGFRKDGERFIAEVIGKSITYMGQDVRVTSVQDISERLKHEEALRTSEERYRLLAENVHDVIWTVDMDLKFTYVSPSILTQRGYTPEEFMSLSIQDVMTRDSYSKVLDIISNVLQPILQGHGDPHSSVTLELDLFHKDGHTIPAEMSINLIMDDEARPMGIQGITRDITERRSAEVLIKESEEQYRSLGDATFDGILIHRERRVLDVNQGFADIFGYALEELLGKDPMSLVAPDDQDRIKTYISTEYQRPYEFIGLKKDGTMVHLEAIGKTMPYKGGKARVAAIRDISVRRQAELALEKSEDRYRSLFDNMPSGVVVFEAIANGEDFRIMEFNSAAENIENVDKTDIIGKKVTEAFPGVENLGLFEIFKRVWSTGRAEYFPAAMYRDERDFGSWRENWVYKLPSGEIVAVYNDVTSRKRSEIQIRDSENRYRTIFETSMASLLEADGTESFKAIEDLKAKGVTDIAAWLDENPDFIWETMGKVQIININPETLRFFGVDEAVQMEATIHELFEPDAIDLFKELLIAVFEGREQFKSEFQMQKTSGELIYALGALSLPREINEANRICISLMDITALKKAEAALLESEEMYRLLAENLADVIWSVDGQLNLHYVSPSIRRLAGYTTDETIDMTFEKIMTVESYDLLFEQTIGSAAQEDEGSMSPSSFLSIELEFIHKDGSRIWTESSVSARRDSDGELLGFEGVTRDISDRKIAEMAIMESEEKYRLLAENLEDVIFTMDGNLEFGYISPSFSKLTGFTIEELRELGWASILTQTSFEVAMEMLADQLVEKLAAQDEDGSSIFVEMEIKTKSGKTVWVEVNMSPDRDKDGEFVGLIGVARNVESRKETEKRYLEERKRAELYLDIFTRDIVDINEKVSNYLNFMKDNLGLEGAELNYVKNVLEMTKRTRELVENVNLLAQLRVDTSQPTETDTREALQTAIEMIKDKYPSRKMEIRVAKKASSCNVRASPFLFKIFNAIIDNAINYDRHVKPVVDITMSPTKDGRSCRIEFVDRGPGIPDNLKEKIFNRLDHSGHSSMGTGLGLAVVKAYTNKYGGRVWAEDRITGKPDQGSRFVIELPRVE